MPQTEEFQRKLAEDQRWMVIMLIGGLHMINS
jgi:hypothetical protein